MKYTIKCNTMLPQNTRMKQTSKHIGIKETVSKTIHRVEMAKTGNFSTVVLELRAQNNKPFSPRGFFLFYFLNYHQERLDIIMTFLNKVCLNRFSSTYIAHISLGCSLKPNSHLCKMTSKSAWGHPSDSSILHLFPRM